jgi:hypothetical protein
MVGFESMSDWASSIVTDQERRQEVLRKANWAETACSVLAAVCAIGAVWGFTSDTPILDGIRPETVGGVAVLCFSALMFIAAGAGIQKRIIALISELEKRGLGHHDHENSA